MPIARDCKVYLPIKMLQMGGILRNSTTVDLYGRLSWTWTTWFSMHTFSWGSLVLCHCWPRGIVPFCETSQGFEETSCFLQASNYFQASNRPRFLEFLKAPSVTGIQKRIICEMKRYGYVYIINIKNYYSVHEQFSISPDCKAWFGWGRMARDSRQLSVPNIFWGLCIPQNTILNPYMETKVCRIV